jgi:integrase
VLDRWVEPYLRSVKLRDLGGARVGDWRAAILADGAPPTQANAALSVLSSAFGCAVRDGKLPRNPALLLRKLRVAPSRAKALTPVEVDRLRAAMPTLKDVCLVGLMAYAGLRPEEALALTWTSGGAGTLIIDRGYTAGELKATKTHRRRSVEIVAPLKDDLGLLRPRLPSAEALVITGHRGGFLNLRNWRHRVWHPACRTAGIDAVPYDLRHTYASLLIHEGRPLTYVAAMLGHSTSKTTDIYAHLIEESRHASNVPLADAVYAARAELEQAGVYSVCTRGAPRRLRQAAP